MKYCVDVARELFIRKGGLVDCEDLRDYPIDEEIRGRTVVSPERASLLNTFPQNQGRKGACTGFGAQTSLQIQIIKEKRDGRIWFNGFEQWENQKEYPGNATDRGGDRIVNAFRALKKFGLTHSMYGEEVQYGIKRYMFFDPSVEEIKKNINLGYVPITGAYTKFPIVDKNYIFRPNTKKTGGHCFNIVEYDDNLEIGGKKGFFVCFHNWGRWGAKKAGTFYLHYDDVNCLFRSWIIE